MTLLLTSSCSRYAQKLWWGWVGWGWRQILPPHQRNAKLRDRERKTFLIYFREAREWEETERRIKRKKEKEQAVNHKSALLSAVYQLQFYCSQTKCNQAAEIYGAIIHSGESTWRVVCSGAGLCCPLAGLSKRCTKTPSSSSSSHSFSVWVYFQKTASAQSLTMQEGLCWDEEGSGAHRQQSDELQEPEAARGHTEKQHTNNSYV